MNQRRQDHRIEVTFHGSVPGRQVKRASGVSEVEIDGSTLRCRVSGSFQPFLESLHGYEVICLESTRALDDDAISRIQGGH